MLTSMEKPKSKVGRDTLSKGAVFHTFLRDVFNGGCEHTTNDVEKEIIYSRNMAPKEMAKNYGRVWTPLHAICRSLVCWAWGWGGEERVAVWSQDV